MTNLDALIFSVSVPIWALAIAVWLPESIRESRFVVRVGVVFNRIARPVDSLIRSIERLALWLERRLNRS